MLLAHWQDFAYPKQDSAGYFLITQKIYLAFEQSGWWEGLQSWYLERSWKPLLFPALGVPFLALAGGSVKHAIVLCNSFFLFLFILNLFQLIRNYCNQKVSSLITLSVCFIPYIFLTNFGFMSELFFLAFSMGAIKNFSFFRQEHSGEHKKGLFFYLTLCFLTRPILTLLFFSVPFCVEVFHWRRKKDDFFKVLLFMLGWVSFFTMVILYYGAIEKRVNLTIHTYRHWLLILIFFIFTGAALYYRRRKYALYFMCSLLVSAIWFLPFSYKLIEWIKICTLNPELTSQSINSNQGLIHFLFSKFGDLINYRVMAWLPAGIILISQYGQKKNSAKPGLAVIAFLLIPVVMGLFSYNNDARYYYLSVVMANIVLFIFWLNSNIFKKTGFALFTLVLILDGDQIISYVHGKSHALAGRLINAVDRPIQVCPENYFYTSRIGRDQTNLIAEILSKNTLEQRENIYIFLPQVIEDGAIVKTFDSDSLRLSMAEKINAQPSVAYFSRRSVVRAKPNKSTISTDLVLIGPIENTNTISKQRVLDFLTRHYNFSTSYENLTLLDKISISSEDEGIQKLFYLGRIKSINSLRRTSGFSVQKSGKSVQFYSFMPNSN